MREAEAGSPTPEPDRPAPKAGRPRRRVAEPALRDHRRALLWGVLLFAATAFVFVGVGRHPLDAPPTTTTLPFIGQVDLHTFRAIEEVRNVVFTAIARVLNVIGGGIVTTPLRSIVALWLLFRRRWRPLATWALTWIAAETTLSFAKSYFHRGRPPNPLVATSGYSFPSGHAVAAAATAVALVLVLMPAGSRRRKWEGLAVLFTFVMAFSRVYLNAHWLSDVGGGVLLGTGIAIVSAGLVSEIGHRMDRARPPPAEAADQST
jgi:membrane-associated phospholipid phosphatase